MTFTAAVLLVLATDFTAQLWKEASPVYRKTLDHPFLQGLASGKLPRESFHFYLRQDGLYLRSFAQGLHALAAKAPREEWASTLAKHATEAIEAERQLHRSLLAAAGGDRREEMAPTNRAYTNHLLASVSRLSFTEGLAAMLPCYWIYWEVGKELKRRGSADPGYAQWINQYSAPEYGASVTAVLSMLNEAASTASGAERENARKLFLLSAQYEYMFWDMAWRLEKWPVAAKE
jgi:thiaminase/transcriptional activator TenA